MNPIKYAFLISLILAAGILAQCSQKQSEANELSADTAVTDEVSLNAVQYKTAGIELGSIIKRDMNSVVDVNGALRVPPQNRACVSAFIGGAVHTILAKEGDYVKKGQTLVTLQHPDYIKLQEEYLRQKSNFAFTEKEYLRQHELAGANVGAQKVFQETESNYNSAKAGLLSLEKQLQMLSLPVEEIAKGNIFDDVPVKAPISGYVGQIRLSIGSFAGPNVEILDIVDNSHIHVDLMVYEKDLYRIKIGQKVKFVLTNNANREIEGRIFSISKTFEDETKTIVAHAEILNADKDNLINGMFVNAVINVGQTGCEVLPEEAVQQSDGKEYIFIEKNTSSSGADFRMVEVKTGIADSGYVQVTPLQPLDSEAKIVVKGAYYLLSQLKAASGAGCISD